MYIYNVKSLKYKNQRKGKKITFNCFKSGTQTKQPGAKIGGLGGEAPSFD